MKYELYSHVTDELVYETDDWIKAKEVADNDSQVEVYEVTPEGALRLVYS